MDMSARNQYLKVLQERYFMAKSRKEKGKIHRRYDPPKTLYQRLMESPHIPDKTKSKLKAIYLCLNPAQLKRSIDEKLNKLYKVYQEKNNIEKVEPYKRQTPRSVTS